MHGDMASLTGRVISITGAASGMGNAFARLAAARGARLALADVQKKPLEDLEQELSAAGTEARATLVDVSSARDVDDWINGTVKHFGRLDSSANMAGILHPPQNFVDTTNELWERIIGVNLYGVMNCVRAQLKVMEKGSSIVNITSVLGTHGQAAHTPYSISKHGVVGLTRGVARELTGMGIRINAVAPGPIDTPMVQKAYGDAFSTDSLSSLLPLARPGQPVEVAKLIAFLLSEESSFMHGHVTYIDGGFVC